MNHRRKLGLASFVFLFLGLLSGALPQTGAMGWSAETAAIIAQVCSETGWCWP